MPPQRRSKRTSAEQSTSATEWLVHTWTGPIPNKSMNKVKKRATNKGPAQSLNKGARRVVREVTPRAPPILPELRRSFPEMTQIFTICVFLSSSVFLSLSVSLSFSLFLSLSLSLSLVSSFRSVFLASLFDLSSCFRSSFLAFLRLCFLALLCYCIPGFMLHCFLSVFLSFCLFFLSCFLSSSQK